MLQIQNALTGINKIWLDWHLFSETALVKVIHLTKYVWGKLGDFKENISGNSDKKARLVTHQSPQQDKGTRLGHSIEIG